MYIASTQERVWSRSMNAETYFNSVYHKTSAELMKLIVIKTSNADQVEDILQSVYQEFYARIIKKGYADIKSPAGFLNKLAHQELSRYYKHKIIKKERETDLQGFDDLIPDEGIAFDALLEMRDEMETVKTLVKKLPLFSYKAFVLYYFYDMPVSAIAQSIGISESNVKDRLWRARNAIRKGLVNGYEK